VSNLVTLKPSSYESEVPNPALHSIFKNGNKTKVERNIWESVPAEMNVQASQDERVTFL
jgi:hypothetical protein